MDTVTKLKTNTGCKDCKHLSQNLNTGSHDCANPENLITVKTNSAYDGPEQFTTYAHSIITLNGENTCQNFEKKPPAPPLAPVEKKTKFFSFKTIDNFIKNL